MLIDEERLKMHRYQPPKRCFWFALLVLEVSSQKVTEQPWGGSTGEIRWSSPLISRLTLRVELERPADWVRRDCMQGLSFFQETGIKRKRSVFKAHQSILDCQKGSKPAFVRETGGPRNRFHPWEAPPKKKGGLVVCFWEAPSQFFERLSESSLEYREQLDSRQSKQLEDLLSKQATGFHAQLTSYWELGEKGQKNIYVEEKRTDFSGLQRDVSVYKVFLFFVLFMWS